MAIADLFRSAEWIAAASPQESIRWRERFWMSALPLRRVPGRCPLAPENGFQGREIRQLLFGGYRILFTIHERTVSILHVRHGARRSMS